MRFQISLDGRDSRKLDRNALRIQGAEVPIMGESFADFEDFDVAVRQLPNLAFGELLGRHLLLTFHNIVSDATDRTRTNIPTDKDSADGSF